MSDFAIPWNAVCKAWQSFTISWTLLKVMSTESVMPSNNLFLCCPVLLLPSIFPSIRVFSNELVLHIRWPKYWSFNLTITPSSEYSGLISFRIDVSIKSLYSVLRYWMRSPWVPGCILVWGGLESCSRGLTSTLLLTEILFVSFLFFERRKYFSSFSCLESGRCLLTTSMLTYSQRKWKHNQSKSINKESLFQLRLWMSQDRFILLWTESSAHRWPKQLCGFLRAGHMFAAAVEVP